MKNIMQNYLMWATSSLISQKAELSSLVVLHDIKQGFINFIKVSEIFVWASCTTVLQNGCKCKAFINIKILLSTTMVLPMSTAIVEFI